MKSIINYDFELSKAVTVVLEELVDDLENATSKKLADDILRLNMAWQGQNATDFACKHKSLMKQYELICSDICKQLEELERLSKWLYLEEQKAKEIAQKRECGVKQC